MNRSIIIVAGGKGLRMGGSVPKQFLPIGGKPVLMHTIEAFYQADKTFHIVLVLPVDQQDYWKSLCKQYHFSIEHFIVDGGDSRYQSVKNGLSAIPSDGIVGIHDGVRPFVSSQVIKCCFQEAVAHRAVIPVIDAVESIRHLSGEESVAVPRSQYKLVQTPQVFEAGLLHEAYQQPFDVNFTDDASVVESMGEKIYLIKGNRENIKITTPFDLIIANALLQCRM
jgi:2-C-methyl-D-erythritol 4-phosphate cytidylyltransferase